MQITLPRQVRFEYWTTNEFLRFFDERQYRDPISRVVRWRPKAQRTKRTRAQIRASRSSGVPKKKQGKKAA